MASKQEADAISRIPNKAARRRVRASLKQTRETLAKLKVNVSDFSDDECAAALLALEDAGKVYDVGPWEFLSINLSIIHEHGPRKFFAWCQESAERAQRMTTA